MEVAVSEEQQANVDFASGFPTEPPAVTAKVGDVSAAEPTAKPKDDATAPPVVEAPKLAQLTQEQLDNLLLSATETVKLKSELSKAWGTMGQMKQTIDKLQSQPVSRSLVLEDGDFAETSEDFPDLGRRIRADLEKVFKRNGLNAAETKEAIQKLTPDSPAVQKMDDPETVKALLTELSVQHETAALDDLHPTWRTIIGAQSDAGNLYRQWLAKKPAEYQQKLNSTNTAAVISRSIDLFEAETKATATPAPKDTARSDRIRGAIQPKGDGGQPGPGKTADDEFREGYHGPS